jgi:serine acetyltransferase
MSFLIYLSTDLFQAKIVNSDKKITITKFLYLFFRSKICRIQTFVRLRSRNKLVAFLAKKYLDRYFIEVGINTIIGKYFYLPHPRCIIIAGNVVLGEHVHIGQYVTIGGNFKKTEIRSDGAVQKLPIVGDRVMINAGAVIGGPVAVGDDVIIGANAVITKDVPCNSISFGMNQLAKKKIKLPPEGGQFEQL